VAPGLRHVPARGLRAGSLDPPVAPQRQP
jgi:hypothetical protein